MSGTHRHRGGRFVIVVIGALLIAVAGLATYGLGFLPDPDSSIGAHHLQHLFLIMGGGLWGLVLAQLSGAAARKEGPGPAGWLFVALLVPMLIMFLMWPSSYPYIEDRPALHLLEHLVFIALAALTTFAGYRFAPPAGWLFGASMSAMSAAAVLGFGVAPAPSPLIAAVTNSQAQAMPTVGPSSGSTTASTSASTTSEARSPATVPGAPAANGAAIFSQNCAACHQAEGIGVPGAFPPLAGHLPALLAKQGGREYVIHVLLFGLQGSIEVNGQPYDGTMPSWSQFTDAEIAAVIDHEATSWGNSLPPGQGPITAEEVTATRGQAMTPQGVFEMRQKLLVP